ncbi:putative periodic tryptophan protein 2-like protein [Sesbania bispinosa]|nr:putative periodic tryptophan protein 2-like protein [Sesbania bispinosa]
MCPPPLHLLQHRVALHRISLKHHVTAIKFYPSGNLIVVAAGKLIQIRCSPASRKEYFPLNLVLTFVSDSRKHKHHGVSLITGAKLLVCQTQLCNLNQYMS